MIKLAKIDKQKHAPLSLRIGIAATLLYAAIASFINPNAWIGFFPAFMTNLLPATLLLTTFSIYEMGLGLWILSGKKTFYAAVLSAFTMLGIIVFNLSALDIVFRDVAILLGAVSLAIMTYEKNDRKH